MAEHSNIEWTDATWSPVVGCSKVSPGCANCYAIRDARRLAGNPNPKISQVYKGLTVIQNGKPNWTGTVRCLPERLDWPLRWRKPLRIFVCSQSDLFHEAVPWEFIERVFAVMSLAGKHTFQILTKRPERMREFFQQLGVFYRIGLHAGNLLKNGKKFEGELTFPQRNVWLGVSVEDRAHKNRIDILRETPAAVRFLSLEPLLEDLGELDLRGIYQVILGGESGPRARPSHPDWFRSVRDHAIAADVSIFMKQRGEWSWDSDGGGLIPSTHVFCQHGTLTKKGETHNWNCPGTNCHCYAIARIGKKAAGRLLYGREWNEMPNSNRDREGAVAR